MASPVNLPRGDVYLGWAGPNRLPVTISMEWMRVFTDLVARAGGTSAVTDLDMLTEAAYSPRSDPRVDECLRSIGELSSELASTRGELHNANTRLSEMEAELASLRQVPDLSDRVQQLEDRLA